MSLKIHRVTQGECMATIAAKYNFADWHSIFFDSQNAELRKLRSDPNVLAVGDRVVIPDRSTKSVAAETGKRHVFQFSRPTGKLRLLLKDEKLKPLKSLPYRLMVPDSADPFLEGTLDEEGLLEVDLPLEIEEIELVVVMEPSMQPLSWQLQVGHLEPVDSTAGYQARLINMGFDCGPVDGIFGPRTQKALRSYQSSNGLEVTGDPLKETLDHIGEAHDRS